MVIDSHEHIMFPTKVQLDKMDAAGVDKAILFCSAPHPEKAGNLNELETEMNTLYKILAGANSKEDNIKRLEKNISEITTTINEYPNRFWGFGSVPLGLGLEETQNWIDSQITAHSLCGIGEFTPGNEQQILQLDVVFQAIRNTRLYPVWVHTFNPVTLNGIKLLMQLCVKYPEVPVILRALKKSDSLKKELGFFQCCHYNRSIEEDSEMLKDNSQLKLSLSPYQGIYDAVIPSNHLLRKIKENIDFSFVNPMLRKQYCENFGRPAKEPELMFKLLFLKKLYDLSDESLISSAQTDMAYKCFLDLEPEAKMIDPSLLTKFRRTRITEDILEEMLRETIQQALEKGLIKSGTIIVDSTHTNASVRAKSPTQILRDMSRQLRKEIYKNAFELSEKFPEKPSLEAGLEEETAYTEELLRALEEGIAACGNRKIQELSREMKELLADEKIRDIRSKDDKDARFGHKTATSTFYGYKNHLAMTEDRLITGISVTHGGAPDGQELPGLIEKAQKNGIKVREVIGDMAYVSDDNLEACGKDITLIARTNTAVAAAASGKLEEGFCYNKDAGMLQCPAGELAMRVEKRTAKNGNTYLRYVFSKVKCRKCPLRESCRVGSGKSKERSYSITQASEKNLERLKFEESEYFRERMKIRHRIEEKNGELKEAHGLRRADSRGLFAMELQMYFTAFVANAKRISKLADPVTQ